jgi:integrase/recombinase XerC
MDVKETTYRTYESNFKQFLCFLAVNYDNIDIYSDEFIDQAVDIMEEYIAFCQETLKNHKKTINNKIAAVSSFYIWSMKRGLIKSHPFDKKLDRMKGASEEKVLNSYFLTEEQVQTIRRELELNDKYDIQDQILFEVSYDSANRIGALEKLTLSSLDLDNMVFTEIREKRGYMVDVVFEEKAADLLREWLEMRKEGYDKLEVDAPLITYYKEKYSSMNRGVIHARMRKIGQIVGIEDFRAHCVRKSKLNNVYDETGDLVLAAELGNHKDTSTTMQSYIKKRSKSELRDKINALKAKKDSEE